MLPVSNFYDCSYCAQLVPMSRQPHPLATLAQLASTLSAQDGIPRELEEDLRVVGCMMIQEAGIMLDL